MNSSILEKFAWILARNLVVDQDYTCYAPGVLFEEPTVFRGVNKRGVLIRPIEAEGKTLEEIARTVQEGFVQTEEIARNSGLKGATIIQLLLFETLPNETVLNHVRSLDRHQTYPDVSSYTAVLSVNDSFYQLNVPLYAKQMLSRRTIRKAMADLPSELNLSQLQSQMNQAGEKRRLEWSKIFIQTSSKGTYVFLAFCVLIFVWQTISGSAVTDEFSLLQKFGAKINPLIADGQYWRLLTPVFLHLNLLHLVVNITALYSLRSVEWIFGSYRFLFIFLLAGIGGNTASFVLTSNPSAGASGALFGLMGALLYFGYERYTLFRRVFTNRVWLTLFLNLVVGFAWSFVDNWAHLGGLLTGFLAAVVVGLPGDERLSIKKFAAAVLLIGVLFGGISYGTNKQKNSADYHLFYANQAHTAYNWRLEESELNKALQIDPGNAYAWMRLGQTEIRLNKSDAALKAFQQAEQILPNDPQTHYQLGLFYESQELNAQAAQEYQAALDADPNFQPAKNRLTQLKTH